MSMLRSSVLLIFLGMQYYDSLDAIKPAMKPFNTRLEIEPGKPLQISCVSRNSMRFIKPPPTEFHGFKSSFAIEEQNITTSNVYSRILWIPKTTIADSGFYGCVDDDVDVNDTRHDQPNVSWIEVIIPNW